MPIPRTCLLWYAAHALGVRVILEQPLHRGVHLFKGRRWQELASFHTAPLCCIPQHVLPHAVMQPYTPEDVIS